MSEWSTDRLHGLCAIAVGACLAGTQGGVVMGAGLLVYEAGLHVQGVVGASVVGVRAQGAMSLFDGVTVHLGGVQTGWAGMTRTPEYPLRALVLAPPKFWGFRPPCMMQITKFWGLEAEMYGTFM